MALPANNTAWPPAPWGTAHDVYAENDAWYVGDTTKLQAIYQQQSGSRPTHRHRGQDMTGGVAGIAAGMRRMFWGRPVPPDEHRARLHIPAASDIAVTSSDLLYAEPPKLALPNTGNGQERLDTLMNSDQAHAAMGMCGELASAFGASVLTVNWDQEVSDSAWLKEYGADVAVPEFRNGQLVAVTLWTGYTEDMHVWRHLERHEPGVILHALYRGTDSNLGVQVSMEARPETSNYTTLQGAQKNGHTIALPTGTRWLTAAWHQNVPAREWRKAGVLAHAGRSDFTGGVKGLMDALDDVWSSWMNDIDLGRARLVVPRAYMEDNGPGGGAQFQTDRAIYSPLDIPGRMNEMSIEQVQFNIRVADHERTASALYQRILGSAGLADLGPDEERRQPRTATEAFDEIRAKERTRDKKMLYAKPALARIARAMLAVDGQVFPGKGGGEYDPPRVEFPEVSQDNPEERSRTLTQLRAASLISIETGVRAANPDRNDDDKWVAQEVDRIMTERGMKVSDPARVGRVDADELEAAARRIGVGGE